MQMMTALPHRAYSQNNRKSEYRSHQYYGILACSMLGATAASIVAFADDQENETEASAKLELDGESNEAENKEVDPSKPYLPMGNDMSEDSVYEKIQGPEQIISALEDF